MFYAGNAIYYHLSCKGFEFRVIVLNNMFLIIARVCFTHSDSIIDSEEVT